MKQIKLIMAVLLGGVVIMGCSRDKPETPDEPAVADTAKVAGTNWVPARAVKIQDTTYSYTKVIPYKDASGKLIYDKANSETKQGKGYVYYDEKFKVVYVVDWPGIQGNAAEGAAGFEPFYFNFDKRHSVKKEAAQAGTAAWHIKFYDIYSAYVVTDGDAGSAGDLGKLRVYRTPFDELDEAADKVMTRTSVEIEMDEFPTTDGWGSYRLSDHILRPYKDRSVVFRLKDGRYVKFQLVNLYRSNPLTVTDKYEFEAPYYNFRYYVQQTPDNRNVKTR
ncbi:hypothetical protein HQN86_07555 [Pedobacter panaciterrae]|uniref:hypothetical protein n=1 Tax=Pedobacter panaciterrae TaxID=363849 RepID=UPI00155D9CBE|nr:hypothetical protein [Pedobacter panaciterrae]NQX53466.1 hypothetical protein [Pedobacter panaciterrae]